MTIRPPKEGIKLHIAAWVTWDANTDKLTFYNNEEEYTYRPMVRIRPRRSKHKDTDAYDQRCKEWAVEAPYERISIPIGNTMTQKYYPEYTVPMYIDAIHSLRLNTAESW